MLAETGHMVGREKVEVEILHNENTPLQLRVQHGMKVYQQNVLKVSEVIVHKLSHVSFTFILLTWFNHL